MFRRLDRWAGIPLVFLLGALRRRRRFPVSPRRIGFLKVAAIGDTLLMSAIVQDVRAHWPHAHITFFCGEDNAAAARLIPGIDELVQLPVRFPWRAVAALRRAHIDLLVDCGPWPRINALLSATSGAATVGFRTPGQHRHFAYDGTARHCEDRHEVDNYRALVRLVGVDPSHPPAVLDPASAPVRVPDGPFAVLHMWSGGTNGWQKEWPAERWITVARALGKQGLQVLVSGGRGDATRAAAFVADAGLSHVRSVAGEFELGEMAAVLTRASVLVSVNTGLMHLGAIVGTPTVSLEGPVPVHRWGPRGPRARSVVTRLSGCAFLHLGFEYDGQRPDCMQGVEVDDVLTAIDELLRDTPAGHR